MFKITPKNAFISFFLLMSMVSGTAIAQEQKQKANKAYPPTIESSKVETYRKVGDTELKIWIFEPKEKATKPRPAIVFFFGGGWTSGTPAQFVPQCQHLAERGMVAMVADYRVASRNMAKPIDCVADAKACVRYIRTNAVRLGIDPDRLAAGGGSAGGHLAAATATLPGLEAAGEDLKVSSTPNALVLFNPALVLAPIPGLMLEGFLAKSTKERFGCEPEAFSPAHHVKKGVPPTIIFHGKADSTVPYSSAAEFSERMNKVGNRCQLIGFEGEGHGFFNNKKMKETLDQADEFLVSLGYLPARKQ
jgi:acetyl esterase/lipase